VHPIGFEPTACGLGMVPEWETRLL
jgi:hypothetical protein